MRDNEALYLRELYEVEFESYDDNTCRIPLSLLQNWNTQRIRYWGKAAKHNLAKGFL